MSFLNVPIFMNEECEGSIPNCAYEDDAGYDLFSSETITILPQSCEGVNLKFSTAIPQGYFAKIESRSSMVKIFLITAVGGVIDSNYRGDWAVILFNHGKVPYTVKPGEKIAQAVFHKKETVKFEKVENFFDLGKTERGKKGFGSSDAKKIKIDVEKKSDFICDPDDPCYVGTQPMPDDYLSPEDSDSDCEITAVSGKMTNDKGDVIAEY